MADNRRTEVSDMEGLGNVGRGVVENYRFTLAALGRAVEVTLRENVANNALCKGVAVNFQVKISVNRTDRGKLLTFNAACKRLGNLHGRTTENLGKAEARKCDITHCSVRGILKHSENVICREKPLAKRLGCCRCDIFCSFFLKCKHLMYLSD